eukprot:354419-Chlamydomonas_euryale.AAC.1
MVIVEEGATEPLYLRLGLCKFWQASATANQSCYFMLCGTSPIAFPNRLIIMQLPYYHEIFKVNTKYYWTTISQEAMAGKESSSSLPEPTPRSGRLELKFTLTFIYKLVTCSSQEAPVLQESPPDCEEHSLSCPSFRSGTGELGWHSSASRPRDAHALSCWPSLVLVSYRHVPILSPHGQCAVVGRLWPPRLRAVFFFGRYIACRRNIGRYFY